MWVRPLPEVKLEAGKYAINLSQNNYSRVKELTWWDKVDGFLSPYPAFGPEGFRFSGA
jgi:hypothetical protein